MLPICRKVSRKVKKKQITPFVKIYNMCFLEHDIMRNMKNYHSVLDRQNQLAIQTDEQLSSSFTANRLQLNVFT